MADLTDVIIDGDPYDEEDDSSSTVFLGATANTDGEQGDVPKPLAGDQNKFLTGGRQWEADTANLVTNYTTQDDSETTDIITPSGGETAISTLESGANHARLFNKISRCFLNVRKLINTVKRQWNVIGQTWATGEAVQVNWHRLYNGKWYRCILAHTTSANILPTNTTYWKEVTVDSEITNVQNDIASLNSNYTTLKNKELISVYVEQGVQLDGDGRAYIPVEMSHLISVCVRSTSYLAIPRFKDNNSTLIYVFDTNLEPVTDRPTIYMSYIYIKSIV